jgi:hypothetical protein
MLVVALSALSTSREQEKPNILILWKMTSAKSQRQCDQCDVMGLPVIAKT